ncbi:hypothetical protein [Streptomyces nigrescens]
MVKPLPQARRVAAPQVVERDDAPAQLCEREPEHGVRGKRGQAYLHTLDALGARLERAEVEPGGQALRPHSAGCAVDVERAVTEHDGHGDGWVGDGS